MSVESNHHLKLYAAVVTAVAIAFAAALILAGESVGDAWTVAVLAGVNAVAERGGVQLTRTTQLSIALLPTLFAAVLFGPLAGGVVNAASMLGDPELFDAPDPDRSPRLKWAVYTSFRFIIGATTGFVAQGILNNVSENFGGLLAATMIGAVVAELLDIASAALTGRMRGRKAKDVASALAPLLVTSVPVYGPLVAVLALAYTEVSPWTAPLFFIPTLAAHRLFSLYQQQRQLANDLADVNDTLQRANLSFADALVATLDARDQYTAGHSKAVAIYSRDIARRMSLSVELQERIYLCGLVHDIGKIGLPPGLLEKDGPLTLDERRQMQEHSAIGERILANVGDYAEIALIVRHHHERMDGEGYPDRLRDDDIPLLSRIIAVADAYNAMTSNRPYRDAMPSRVARLRLAQAVETQFDTSAVAAFEAILASADESYRLARRSDFGTFPSTSHDSVSKGAPDAMAGAA